MFVYVHTCVCMRVCMCVCVCVCVCLPYPKRPGLEAYKYTQMLAAAAEVKVHTEQNKP
jgi:hypothetical protein